MLDGSVELLQAARHRYKTGLAIVTNCPRKITQIILSHLQLEEYFIHTVCAGDSILVSSLLDPMSCKNGRGTTKNKNRPHQPTIKFKGFLPINFLPLPAPP